MLAESPLTVKSVAVEVIGLNPGIVTSYPVMRPSASEGGDQIKITLVSLMEAIDMFRTGPTTEKDSELS